MPSPHDRPERLEEAAGAVLATLQDLANTGTIGPDDPEAPPMVTGFAMVITWTDAAGGTGSTLLSDSEATPPVTAGLLRVAVVSNDMQIEAWLTDEDYDA